MENKQKRLLAALVDAWQQSKARETGVLFIGLLALSKKAGMPISSLKISLKALERLGLIKCNFAKKQDKPGEASSFVINFDALSNCNILIK